MARILIIEDEEPVRALMEQSLRVVGYQVVVAANGNQGLNLHRVEAVDLIITDLSMPDMEGLELLNTLRKERADTPIIAVSGNPDFKSALDIASRLGAVKTIPKPFSPEELRVVVAMILRRP